KSTAGTRLCPNCANSIAEDAEKCNYCKADLAVDDAPAWLKRGETSSEPRVGSNNKKKFPIPSKFLWPAAMLVVALIAFFAGGHAQRSELSLATQANLKQLQAKDQMIQSQEAQLAQTRQQLNESSAQLAALKTKLEESQKEHSATQQRLAAARQVERTRSNASQTAPAGRTASRAPRPAASSPAPARRTAEPGVYETTQATSVYENPSSSARVISQIGRGTRINVVNSAGEWLEVRSKHGNPPGYVRSADARQLGRVN
ncbi:MAG TPA: SH3 domain-containing protein, partial [Candidatus Limnocylindria bacterium]|nr:SH3 domain-containing protein [Candidatus Limnocylindria bacterium]